MKYRILFIDRATASAPKARAAVRLKLKVLNQSFNLIRNYLPEARLHLLLPASIRSVLQDNGF